MYYLIPILIFIILSKLGTYYYTENFLGAILLAGAIGFAAWKTISMLTGVFFFYVMANTIYYLFYQPSAFDKFGLAYSHFLKSRNAMGAICGMLFFFGVMFIRKDHFRELLRGLPWVCWTAVFIVIYTQAFNGSPTGIVGATSIDSALIGCLYPFAHCKAKRWKAPLKLFHFAMVLLSVMILNGSIGYACFAVSVLIAFLDLNKWKMHLFKSSLISVGIMVIAHSLMGMKLFDSSSRFHMYYISIKWWLQNANQWIGTGLSTYWVYGPLIQDENKWYKSDYFTFLHSDILQILFELGWIGMFLFIALIVTMIIKVVRLRDNILLASIASYLVFMLLYFPLHSFITGLLGAIIFRTAITRERL